MEDYIRDIIEQEDPLEHPSIFQILGVHDHTPGAYDFDSERSKQLLKGELVELCAPDREQRAGQPRVCIRWSNDRDDHLTLRSSRVLWLLQRHGGDNVTTDSYYFFALEFSAETSLGQLERQYLFRPETLPDNPPLITRCHNDAHLSHPLALRLARRAAIDAHKRLVHAFRHPDMRIHLSPNPHQKWQELKEVVRVAHLYGVVPLLRRLAKEVMADLSRRDRGWCAAWVREDPREALEMALLLRYGWLFGMALSSLCGLDREAYRRRMRSLELRLRPCHAGLGAGAVELVHRKRAEFLDMLEVADRRLVEMFDKFEDRPEEEEKRKKKKEERGDLDPPQQQQQARELNVVDDAVRREVGATCYEVFRHLFKHHLDVLPQPGYAWFYRAFAEGKDVVDRLRPRGLPARRYGESAVLPAAELVMNVLEDAAAAVRFLMDDPSGVYAEDHVVRAHDDLVCVGMEKGEEFPWEGLEGGGMADLGAWRLERRGVDGVMDVVEEGRRVNGEADGEWGDRTNGERTNGEGTDDEQTNGEKIYGEAEVGDETEVEDNGKGKKKNRRRLKKKKN